MFKTIKEKALSFGLISVLWPFNTFFLFRARLVNLATLFLGKPPRQFTSTKCPKSRALGYRAPVNVHHCNARSFVNYLPLIKCWFPITERDWKLRQGIKWLMLLFLFHTVCQKFIYFNFHHILRKTFNCSNINFCHFFLNDLFVQIFKRWV